MIEADQCGQNADKIGIAVNNATDPIWNIRAKFDCVCKACLKLTGKSSHFLVARVEFLSERISEERISLQSQSQKLCQHFKISGIEKNSIRKQLPEVRNFLQEILYQNGQETQFVLQISRSGNAY